MIEHHALGAVPGVAQTLLDEAELRALAPLMPPPAAPWTVRLRAVVWTTLAGRAAQEAMATGLERTGPAISVVGAMVRYEDSPVGEYAEVLGAVTYRSSATSSSLGGLRATVPFIAVDSLRSLAGGRANWSLPKVCAHIEGEPADTMSASCGRWSVETEARPFGPVVPFRNRATLAQMFPDGSAGLAELGVDVHLRPARVRVGVRGERSLTGWMRSGWHLGAVVESGGFTLEASR